MKFMLLLFGFLNKIALYKDTKFKNLNFIYNIFLDVITVCSSAIELVIVLA